jgi:hypothetical protein
VPGQQSSSTPNRSGHLKDFGEQDDPWVTAFSDRIQNVGTHWPGWRWDIDEFVVCDDHKAWNLDGNVPRTNERIVEMRKAKLIAKSLDKATPIWQGAGADESPERRSAIWKMSVRRFPKAFPTSGCQSYWRQ